MMVLKLIKALLALLVVLALVIGVGGLLLPPQFKVARSVSIEAAPDKVYALVSNPRNWQQWSVWNRRDPGMRMTYSGADNGAGAVWAWQSPSEGDGRMSFTAAEPPRRLAYDLYFPDFGSTSRGEFRFTPRGSGTDVTWTMDGDIGGNPLYRWFALFADRLVGQDFQTGLANLKALAEGH